MNVKVINFPKKTLLENITSWATVGALIVSSVALVIYTIEFGRKPDLRLQVNNSYAIQFKEENFSEPTEFLLNLNNKGNEDSHSLFFTIIFTNTVKIELDSNGNTKNGNLDYIFNIDKWKSAKMINSGNKIFVFNAPDFIVPKNGFSKSIGKFKLQIPKLFQISKLAEQKIQIAMVYFDGDFEKKAYIIYYDYGSKEFLTKSYANMNDVAKEWKG